MRRESCNAQPNWTPAATVQLKINVIKLQFFGGSTFRLWFESGGVSPLLDILDGDDEELNEWVCKRRSSDSSTPTNSTSCLKFLYGTRIDTASIFYLFFVCETVKLFTYGVWNDWIEQRSDPIIRFFIKKIE